MLALLRKVAAERKMNTAALARAAGLDRSHLKHVLAGTTPLTVDELIALSQALEIGPEQLGLAAEEPPPAPQVTPISRGSLARVVRDDEDEDPIRQVADPLGNHAEQVIRLGLALGCDLHLVLDTAQARESGVPASVLGQFPERLPLRLDAAFHRHHDLRFLPQGVQMTLSFDALYTCVFPWSAILQVTIFPLAPSAPPPEPPPEEPSARPRRGSHLRLVE